MRWNVIRRGPWTWAAVACGAACCAALLWRRPRCGGGAQAAGPGAGTRITINGPRRGPVFDGLGAADAGGAMGRLLIDYPAAQRTRCWTTCSAPAAPTSRS